MARLHEYQGKALFKKAGMPIPRGDVAKTPEEAASIAEKIGKPVVVKVQIWTGGRGKAGGVKFADTPAEAKKVAAELLGATIKGLYVESVLVEEKLAIDREYYAGIIVNASADARCPVVMFSTEGGMDIEAVPHDKIALMNVDVIRGFRIYDALNLANKLNVPSAHIAQVAKLMVGLYETFKNYGARLIEINPMVVTKAGKVLASDCRISIDDSSVIRHPELGIDVAREASTPPTELDKIAWWVEENDLRGTCYFAEMNNEITDKEVVGTIGYHGMGGGGAMLGVDGLNKQGLKVADFADTSGNPPASKVYRAAKLVFSQPGIDGYMLGGFMAANQEQWHHAHGVVKALREEMPKRPGFPVILLLAGNKEKESLEILREGTKDLKARIRIYGGERVYDTVGLAAEMKEMVLEYRKEQKG
ncbi:MAG: acetate--CoA ligase family protein [Syntrophobacterales bacterium]|nr:acetate--CoA ligase family protein [Syntrophobacterales bacterium]